MMVSFVLSFFPRDVLDEILNLIESVSEDFPSYSLTMSPESDEDINMLEYIIVNDVNLGHRETGLNILGWIYKKEGNKDKARDCFQRSLQSQGVYNAAKLHMSELAL